MDSPPLLLQSNQAAVVHLCRPFSDLFAECLYLYLCSTEQPGCSSARPPTFFSSFCSPASASYVASNAFLTCWHVCNLHTWIVRYMHTWIPPGTTLSKYILRYMHTRNHFQEIYIQIYAHLEPLSRKYIFRYMHTWNHTQ